MAIYQTNSIPWQIQLQLRNLQEEIEWQLNSWFSQIPTSWRLPGWPVWLEHLCIWLACLGLGLLAYWIGKQLYRLARATAWTRGRRSPAYPISLPEERYPAHYWQHQGNYREACRALYLNLLEQLNDQQILPHELSRTDGEYLRALETLVARLLPPWQLLLSTHGRLCFSTAEISAADFEQCQQAYNQCIRQIQQLKRGGGSSSASPGGQPPGPSLEGSQSHPGLDW